MTQTVTGPLALAANENMENQLAKFTTWYEDEKLAIRKPELVCHQCYVYWQGKAK